MNSGSPPHTRGKAVHHLSGGEGRRITPAYAGKRGWRSSPEARRRDHPRIRGEKRVWAAYLRQDAGSPPHTRGKELDAVLIGLLARITPAYAGKRDRIALLVTRLKDHPRIRGEKRRSSSPPRRVRGSPPHTRGKGQPGVFVLFQPGITPAYAGKRACTRARSRS